MTVQLPVGHPLATMKGQFKFLGGIVWRWFGSGLVGSIVEMNAVSILLSFTLFALWFWSLQATGFWSPYVETAQPPAVWLARVVMVAMVAYEILDKRWDKAAPYFYAWAGFVLALLFTSFLTKKQHNRRDTET